jgi:RNA polymerase sigma factor (sigma-70 family)
MAPLARPALLTSPVANALARYASTRDAEAFRALVDEHRGMVESTCAGVLGRRSPELDDAVQETFVKLARSAPAIHGNVGAWLCRCARTTALDRWRARRDRRGAEELDGQVACLAPDHAQAEQLRIVRECLAELPERPRQVLHAYFFERLTQREIARGLGVSQVAVQKRLTVALELLRARCVRRGVGAAALALLLGGAADGATVLKPGAVATLTSRSGLRLVALLGGGLVAGLITLLAVGREPSGPASPPPPATGTAATAQPPTLPVPPRPYLATLDDHAAWMVAGDLPTRWDGGHALIATRRAPGLVVPEAGVLAGGGLRSLHAWPLTATPLALRLNVDIPEGGRFAIIAAAFVSDQEAPGREADRGVLELYWQSAPLLRGPAAMEACLSELGGKAFSLAFDQPQAPTTSRFLGGEVRPLSPGHHALAIVLGGGRLRTEVDGTELYHGALPDLGATAQWIRFQFGVQAPAAEDAAARTVRIEDAVVDQDR